MKYLCLGDNTRYDFLYALLRKPQHTDIPDRPLHVLRVPGVALAAPDTYYSPLLPWAAELDFPNDMEPDAEAYAPFQSILIFDGFPFRDNRIKNLVDWTRVHTDACQIKMVLTPRAHRGLSTDVDRFSAAASACIETYRSQNISVHVLDSDMRKLKASSVHHLLRQERAILRLGKFTVYTAIEEQLEAIRSDYFPLEIERRFYEAAVKQELSTQWLSEFIAFDAVYECADIYQRFADRFIEHEWTLNSEAPKRLLAFFGKYLENLCGWELEQECEALFAESLTALRQTLSLMRQEREIPTLPCPSTEVEYRAILGEYAVERQFYDAVRLFLKENCTSLVYNKLLQKLRSLQERINK